MVELALLLPILSLLMLGSLDFGRAYYFYAGVTNAARVGAQYAMDPKIADTEVVQVVIREAAPYIVLDPGSISVTYPEGKIQGKEVRVQAVFNLAFLTPGANRLWGNGITMTCRSVGRYE